MVHSPVVALQGSYFYKAPLTIDTNSRLRPKYFKVLTKRMFVSLWSYYSFLIFVVSPQIFQAATQVPLPSTELLCSIILECLRFCTLDHSDTKSDPADCEQGQRPARAAATGTMITINLVRAKVIRLRLP